MVITQHVKSQQACITALAPGDAHIHPLCWSSSNPKGMPEYIGVALVVVDGQLNIWRWEETASASSRHVWFADCESLFSNLVLPDKHIDKKIGQSALEQLMRYHRQSFSDDTRIRSVANRCTSILEISRWCCRWRRNCMIRIEM